MLWSTNLIGRNETAIVRTPAGAGFPQTARTLAVCAAGTCVAAPLIDAWERSVKFVIPPGLGPGILSLRDPDTSIEIARLNEADPWFVESGHDPVLDAPPNRG